MRQQWSLRNSLMVYIKIRDPREVTSQDIWQEGRRELNQDDQNAATFGTTEEDSVRLEGEIIYRYDSEEHIKEDHQYHLEPFLI